MFDDGHHKFSLAWHFMGLAEEVHAWIGQTEIEPGVVLDSPAIVSWKFPGNRYGSLEVVRSAELVLDTNHYAQDDRIEITGTRGVIWVTRGHGKMLDVPPVVLYRDRKTHTYSDMPVGWEHSFINSTKHFIDAYFKGKPPILTGEQGREILRFALAAEESAPPGSFCHALAPAGRVRTRLTGGSVHEYLARHARPHSHGARGPSIAAAGGIEQALASGVLARFLDLSTSEAIVLGLLRQDVRRFLCVFGHGSTDLGEVLRIYAGAGLIRVLNVRSEIEAAHAATALRWATGEKAAVVTSIGPGALQAMAGSLVAASDGVGVWHIYGDETTEDEGPNMQQIPRAEQGLFLGLAAHGPPTHCTRPGRCATALRRGMNTVDHPHRAGPFFLLLPLNTQPALIHDFNLAELPAGAPPRLGGRGRGGTTTRLPATAGRAAGGDQGRRRRGVRGRADRVGRPGRWSVRDVPDQRRGRAGQPPARHDGRWIEGVDQRQPRDGERRRLLAVGRRAVCQSDSSRTGYPHVRHVVNINTDPQSGAALPADHRVGR